MAVRHEYSAGGVVSDQDGRIVLIRTTNLAGDVVWAMPKGHPEAGESGLAAALREASEETGLEVEPNGEEPAASIEYWYTAKDGARVRKRVDWFRMTAIGPSPAGHDKAEVDEVAALPPGEAKARLTYHGERKALVEALRDG